MASDGSPGAIPAVNAVTSTPAVEPIKFQQSGKSLPQSGNGAAAAAAAAALKVGTASQSSRAVAPAAGSAKYPSTSTNSSPPKAAPASSSDPQALVEQINKYLNNSGRADQFRVDPASDKYIQQVNPASGAVIAEYSVAEFPALARSIGAAGLLVDETV
jgi:hypothetical protein